jgi:hypothetical protein
LIDEVLQQVTTTVTSTASQLDFKTELSFWFTIIGSGFGFVLGAIRVWEWYTSRAAKWLNLLAPNLREIRTLMKDTKFAEADSLYHREIHGKGFEPALRKISRDTAIPVLFYRLSILLLIGGAERFPLIEDVADTASKIVLEIDKILEKAKGV